MKDSKFIRKLSTEIQEMGEFVTLSETDGDWGGASLSLFVHKGVEGFVLHNTEAHTKNLMLPFNENIYGTLKTTCIFLDTSIRSIIESGCPNYEYAWSQWENLTEVIFSLISRNKIWVIEIEGTILKGLTNPFLIEEVPSVIYDMINVEHLEQIKIYSMTHIIFDLEATCWEEDGEFQREQSEIIEIGAIKYHNNVKVSEFSQFIKPVKHPQLSSFCTKLTTIKQEDIDNAPLFNEAIKNFEKWILEGNESNNIVFWSCGDYDSKQINRECILNGYQGEMQLLLLNAKNIKHVFGDATGKRKGRGMNGMLEHFGIASEGVPHRGIDDTRNISKIFEKLYPFINTWLR